MDGIPIEFYKKFWEIIEPLYVNMIFEAKQLGQLPFSTKTSVLSVIHKSDTKQILDNYRPLSLSNYDYKIIAFVFGLWRPLVAFV